MKTQCLQKDCLIFEIRMETLCICYQTDNNGVTWFYLSMHVSWKFTNLNVAFRSVMKEPTRSLHIYSDVGGSSMVGNRMTDLLREIKYRREGRGKVYFEPTHNSVFTSQKPSVGNH